MPSGSAPQYDKPVPKLPRNNIRSQVAGNVAIRNRTTLRINARIIATSQQAGRALEQRTGSMMRPGTRISSERLASVINSSLVARGDPGATRRGVSEAKTVGIPGSLKVKTRSAGPAEL